LDISTNEDYRKYLYLDNIKEAECLNSKVSKLKRKLHNGNPLRVSRILEIIHSDVMGPINKSVTGKNYILTFLDEYL
jgi:hypothetical protein